MIYSTHLLRIISRFRLPILVSASAVILTVSLWLGYQLRFDFVVPAEIHKKMGFVFLWVIPLKIALLFAFKQFAGILSYFSVPDLKRLVGAMVTASLLIGVVRYLEGVALAPPRGVILSDMVLSIAGLCALRLGCRMFRESYLKPENRSSRRARRVGIIGAGDVGAHLARELMVRKGLGLRPIVFFDDNPRKWRSLVHGIPVIGAPETMKDAKERLNLEEVIIAMPAAPAKRIGEVVKILQDARLKFETVPSIDQLATGQVKISQLRSVEIGDLLGREPVRLETNEIRRCLEGKTVMVTGAGGSIGSELCRQILRYRPDKLLLVEQSEVQIFQIEQELIESGHQEMIVPLVADILDEARMRDVFERFSPDTVFHAAAHKHVPMMESQPGEAIKNNSFGTVRVAELACEYGADRFVLISTDKAINPTNVMGATKRLAEIFLQAFNATCPSGTRFMAVRFGNVLGSSGSVIPTFKKQIAQGGPIKVTHPEVTRYFMTIPEAVGLVLQSATQGAGGEIFVLDMGQPVKIVDLATQLVELSGLRPGEDIEIEFIGLRPGEKLFEELQHTSENVGPTAHPKIMELKCKPVAIGKVRSLLHEFSERLDSSEPESLKRLLHQAVPEYRPYLPSEAPEESRTRAGKDMPAKPVPATGKVAGQAAALP